MIGSALAFVLARLDQLDSPVFSHAELSRFPAAEVAGLRHDGILYEGARAEEIERPSRLRVGGRLAVRHTARGIFGCPCEGDPYFDPLPLTEDDVRQYEVALAALAARLREENQIDGAGYINHGGLIPIGHKALPGAATVDVYLSVPNADERDVITRCQRMARPPDGQLVVFVTPRGVALSPEGRRVLDGSKVIIVPLTGVAAKGRLSLDWDGVLGGIGVSPGEPCLGLTPTDAAVVRAYHDWESRRVRRNGIPVPPTVVHLMEETGFARATVIDSRKKLKSERFLEQIPNARPGALRLTKRGLRLRPPAKA